MSGIKLRFSYTILLILILSILLFCVKSFNTNNSATITSARNNYTISIFFADPSIKAVSSDPASKILVVALVRDCSGSPLHNIAVTFSVNSQYGKMAPITTKTNQQGECLAYFIPQSYLNTKLIGEKTPIIASLPGKNASASIEIGIVPVPVVLIHGYQASSLVFANMKNFLSSNNINCITFEYKSTEGVEKSALELNSFLSSQKQEFLKKGLLINRFDIISHSLGGIVSRYYTSSDYYIKENTIRKLIMLAVPNHGSAVASFAEDYFKDVGIKDLSPQSSIFVKKLPSMINKGLNNNLEIGNIIIQNDEVVSEESASLKEWGIQSDIFNTGKNILINSENLAGQTPTQDSNHHSALNNSKIFDKILTMLNQKLPNPKTLK